MCVCVCVFFGGGEVIHLALTDLVGNKDLSADDRKLSLN